MCSIVGDIECFCRKLSYLFNFHGFRLRSRLGGWDAPVGEQNLPRPPAFDPRKVLGVDDAVGVSGTQDHVVVTPEQLEAVAQGPPDVQVNQNVACFAESTFSFGRDSEMHVGPVHSAESCLQDGRHRFAVSAVNAYF